MTKFALNTVSAIRPQPITWRWWLLYAYTETGAFAE